MNLQLSLGVKVLPKDDRVVLELAENPKAASEFKFTPAGSTAPIILGLGSDGALLSISLPGLKDLVASIEGKDGPILDGKTQRPGKPPR